MLNISKKNIDLTILICCLFFVQSSALSQEVIRQKISLERAGEQPKYNQTLCSGVAENKKLWNPEFPDEKAVVKIIGQESSAQTNGLLSFVGQDVMWWIRSGNAIDIITLPSALHESNHIIDSQLTSCNGYKAAYFFDGKAYFTELPRGSTPLYVIAAEKIPARLKSKPLGRYANYFLSSRPAPGNDLVILVDELNAYLTGAQLELALTATYIYRDAVKSGNYISYDGNIQGAADFMLYFLAYLKAVQEQSPESYLRIKHSHLFIEHLQRLWSRGEVILNSAKKFSTEDGGLYFIDKDVIAVIYSDSYISELDKLGIRHAAKTQINPAQ